MCKVSLITSSGFWHYKLSNYYYYYFYLVSESVRDNDQLVL
jgi:hypothetical protein